MTIPYHPLAELFPLMEGAAFEKLVADIKAHGLHNPITLYETKILDGRNRERACEEAGVEPFYDGYDGGRSLGLRGEPERRPEASGRQPAGNDCGAGGKHAAAPTGG